MAADGSDDPELAPVEALDRREFLRVMGASIAMTTAGCTSRPRERVLPYVEQPPEVVPGRPLWFATSMIVDGYGHGLLVESHEGRPTKIEGHPEHPANLGAASLHAQASILGLYDPDRARSAREHGRPRSVRSIASTFAPTGGSPSNRTGAGLHVLMEPTSSPLIGSLLDDLAHALPQARVHFHAPLAPTEQWEGARLAFGKVLEPQHDFRKARVVVAFDADFLGSGPAAVRHARDFMSARGVRAPTDPMNRLYVVESTLTSTGAKADHRLRRRPSEIPLAALALLSELRGLLPKDRMSALGDSLGGVEVPSDLAEWARVVARDLAEHRGEALLLVGYRQPAALHALIYAVNELLGNTGFTVTYTLPPPIDAGSPSHGLLPLVSALAENAVGTLIILDGNPVYTAPERLAFAQALKRAPRRIYLGQYENETAALCPSFLPALHYLESWGDTRAFDGTVSFVQPLVEPLYGGFSPAEILAALAGRPPGAPRSLLRSYWAAHGLRGDDAWDDAIGRGVLPGSAFEVERSVVDVARMAEWVRPLTTRLKALFEVQIVPDARVFDGRFANNAWLQETPDPMSRLSWGNAALVSSRTAQDLGVVTGGLVRIATHEHSIDIPALIMPGQADGAITIPLGYGRRGAESVAREVGVSASAFLHDGIGAPSELSSVAAISGSVALALQHTHASLEGRDVARSRTLASYRDAPGNADVGKRPMLYHFARSATEQWAMSIDLTACTGCSACVVACQAENNVPVVGKDWVLRAREMHWLRIDRYLVGDAENPSVELQPMLCQHCEKAPCEYVCPVGATTHSDEGLNEMTYNRCVGTRFCSNNCPYKVRRFNYLNYNASLVAVERLAKNPDVTVRARGVMEKCTYCVQRIRAAEVTAKTELRRLQPDEVTTACAQTCPTQAIQFGSLTADSEVARLRKNSLTYAALGDLGTKPRTTYLARLTNPNPKLETA